MKKRRRYTPGIELGFGIDAYVSLGMSGFFCLLPIVAGVAPVAAWLGGFDSRAGTSSPIADVVVPLLSALSIGVAPWLIPCLVLRARQPKGAHIDWSSDEIFERDGPWKRTVIRWDHAEAGLLVHNAPSRMHSRRLAIQIWDKTNPSAVITAWEETPEEAPLVRRRLEARRLSALDGAIERHVGYKGQFEMERVIDPDRVAQTTLVRWVTRLGYVGGFLGPIFAEQSPAIGLPISAAAALLLTWRAAPVFRELVRVGAKLGARDPGEVLAWRYRFRAVLAEAIVRGTFVILPLVGAVASALTGFK